MANYVVVHGAWSGSFQWKQVAARLRSMGHEVYTPTLTGVGERSHLAHPDIDLDTHIQDIVNVLAFEELQNVILTGHSYGGMVITGVAEQVPERLSHLVYIDAFVPRDGESAWTLMAEVLPSAALDAMEQMVETDGAGWYLPPPPKRSDGRDFPEGRPQPIKTLKQTLSIANPKAAALPRTFIYCSDNPPDYPFETTANRAKASGMRYYDLPTNHSVFDTMPGEITAILAETSTL